MEGGAPPTYRIGGELGEGRENGREKLNPVMESVATSISSTNKFKTISLLK